MKTPLMLFIFFVWGFQTTASAQSGEKKIGNVKTLPNLYILSIGVPAYNLEYTKIDAESIFNIFKSQEGLLFGKVRGEILVCKEKTTNAIIKDKIELLKDTYQITASDILLLFLSGHGQVTTAFNGIDFGFASSEDVILEKNKLISYRQDILSPISKLPCKCLIFIDACQTGSITGQKANENDQIQKQLSEIQKQIVNTPASIITFSSSSNDESSWEDKQWGHGAYTKAIIDGLAGVADKNKDSLIYVQELADYVIERVPKLVEPIKNKTQKPRIVGQIENDYVIFNYINKSNNYQWQTENCESSPPNRPIFKPKKVAIVGLLNVSSYTYDDELSNIIQESLANKFKDSLEFVSEDISIKFAEKGLANQFLIGQKPFIDAEFNEIDYFLIAKKDVPVFEQEPDRRWITNTKSKIY